MRKFVNGRGVGRTSNQTAALHRGLERIALATVFVWLSLVALCQEPSGGRRTCTPEPGERVDQLLTRCGIVEPGRQATFIALNWKHLGPDDGLILGVKYVLPTAEDLRNRAALIAEANKERAAYRARMGKSSGKSAAQKASVAAPVAEKKERERRRVREPLLGRGNSPVEVLDNTLRGATYYVVSGHGGPDPGALGTYKGVTISEDEYAYDIALRLARQLLSHGARVHIIIQDDDDGIRDDEALPCDDHETCCGAPIPLDQNERLRQRCDTINALYSVERRGGSYCRSIFLHVDSRSKEERIDVFFYHYLKSSRGVALATCLRDKLTAKYAEHQPLRGFSGQVTERNLYVLRETNPPGVLVEVANIQNADDMVRLVKWSNREALAKWLSEGLADDYRQHGSR